MAQPAGPTIASSRRLGLRGFAAPAGARLKRGVGYNYLGKEAEMSDDAAAYLAHARKLNETAGGLLRLDTKDADALSGKISIGLSLQAIELAGKAIMRTMGLTVEQIRKKHGRHDLCTLLSEAEELLAANKDSRLIPLQGFLFQCPTIDGVRFGTSIGGYLRAHFAEGPSAFPRSYLYPDYPVFTGPVPVQAINVMAHELIEIADIIDKTLGAA